MFYIVESAITAEGTATAVTKKNDFREAQMLYFQTLASMTANDNVDMGFCTILENDGRQMFEYTTRYTKPVE